MKEEKKVERMLRDHRKKRRNDKIKRQIDRDKDHHIFDDYLCVISFLHKTQRYQEFFDPHQLKMYLISPDMDKLKDLLIADEAIQTFVKGCQLYQKGRYAASLRAFKILKEPDSMLHYEANFNIGACFFKLGQAKQALKFFSRLLNQ